MRWCLFISLLLFVIADADAQQGHDYHDYPSTAEKAYREQRENISHYHAATVEEILALKYDPVKLVPSHKKGNKFKTIYELTPHELKYEKLWEECMDKGRKELNGASGSPACEDITAAGENEKIAGISLNYVLRDDSLDNLHVLLFEDWKFDYNASYWIAISTDAGHSWKYYYTGLSRDNFYHIKVRSKIPFIKDAHTVRAEMAIVRESVKVSDMLIRDNLIAKIDLDKLTKDADGDGLTDVVERRLGTNPESADTDMDGLADAIDHNPRYKPVQNKYTVLYRHLLEWKRWTDTLIIPFNEEINTSVSSFDSSALYYVITDDSNVRHVSGTEGRYIVFTLADYKAYNKINLVPVREVSITPMFPVDNMPGYFKVVYSFSGPGAWWGHTYLVKEEKDHWVVSIGMMWQS